MECDWNNKYNASTVAIEAIEAIEAIAEVEEKNVCSCQFNLTLLGVFLKSNIFDDK